MKHKSLAIIPARLGSKRIKKKNIKLFFGKPIIYYTIKAAIQSHCFDKIIVSTESKIIANIAKKFGAEINFIRPKHLGSDNTSTIKVIKHAINFYKKKNINYKFIGCLYPASPFVKFKDIEKAYNKIKGTKFDFSFTVQKFPSKIERAMKLNKSLKLRFIKKKYLNKNSNKFDESFFDAGQFYIGKTNHFFKKNLINQNTFPIILNKYENIDINDIEDWKFAQKIFKIKNYKSKI